MKIAAATVVLFLMIGAAVGGSYALSLHVSRQSTQNLCDAFSAVVQPPAPPVNTALKKVQAEHYRSLLVFERRLGCR